MLSHTGMIGSSNDEKRIWHVTVPCSRFLPDPFNPFYERVFLSFFPEGAQENSGFVS